ncbi:hypothetical protein E2320_022816 [Naja naja]|nr:hypothetical protein E2320_022816 [Naja naja]
MANKKAVKEVLEVMELEEAETEASHPKMENLLPESMGCHSSEDAFSSPIPLVSRSIRTSPQRLVPHNNHRPLPWRRFWLPCLLPRDLSSRSASCFILDSTTFTSLRGPIQGPSATSPLVPSTAVLCSARSLSLHQLPVAKMPREEPLPGHQDPTSSIWDAAWEKASLSGFLRQSQVRATRGIWRQA